MQQIYVLVNGRCGRAEAFKAERKPVDISNKRR
jgi:hypothetical protein